jgi:hypothetical protein
MLIIESIKGPIAGHHQHKYEGVKEASASFRSESRLSNPWYRAGRYIGEKLRFFQSYFPLTGPPGILKLNFIIIKLLYSLTNYCFFPDLHRSNRSRGLVILLLLISFF